MGKKKFSADFDVVFFQMISNEECNRCYSKHFLIKFTFFVKKGSKGLNYAGDKKFLFFSFWWGFFAFDSSQWKLSLLWPTKCCVHAYPKFHLFTFYMWVCCGYIMLLLRSTSVIILMFSLLNDMRFFVVWRTCWLQYRNWSWSITIK